MRMGSSAALGFHQMWNEEKHHLKVKHESDIAFLNDLFEKEKQELREVNDTNLQRLKATVPSSLYQDLVLPMAEKALNYDLRQIENSHKKQTELAQKSHKDQRARKEIAYHEKLRLNMAQTKRSPSATEGSGAPQLKDVSIGPVGPKRDHQPMPLNSFASPNPVQRLKLTKPLACTVQSEVINGEQRLVMRVQTQPKKRKASASEELPPKRPHLDTSIDTSINSLRTPVSAPISQPSQQPERTITFDEVYQNGDAKYKHTIVEWPVHSKKWYIVKCEQHSLHFTLNPVAGAARHLNGSSHGLPDRNRDSAVKALGYRVLDCDETQVRLHNEIVEKAYANGYKPLGFKGNRLEINRRKRQSNGQVAKGASASCATNSGPTQEKEATLGRPSTESGRETKDASSPQSAITNPKTFHIYYGHWKVNGCKKGEIYPVMILGWDDQTGSGLKDTDLHDTGLLKKTSHPPNCYSYDSRKIVGWAPGYEDGGPKVELRRFPVMFFDQSQTVAWFPAADLLKFPLYKRKAPDRPDHPFNAARRWIAEREGFKTWEDREKSRLNALELRPPSSYSKTSAEAPLGNPDPSADSDDSDDSDSGSDAASNLSTETEKMMKQLQERGGEVSGDDDYSTSASDIHDGGIDDKEIDENLDFEVEEWIRDNASNRPWAFYQLRGQDAEHRAEGAADTQEAHEAQETHGARETHEIQEGPSMTSESTAMGSAHKLAIQACYSPNTCSSLTDSQTPHEKPIHDANSRKENATDVTRGDGRLERSTSTADSDSHSSHYQYQSEGARKRKREEKEETTSMNGTVPELSSSRVSLPSPTFNKAYSKETLYSREDRPNAVPATPDTPSIGDPLVGKFEQTLCEETPKTSNSTIPSAEPAAPGAASMTHIEFADDIADANPDYELSLFSNGVTSWERSNEDEDCVKLFYSADRMKAATRGGLLNVAVDPTEIASFSREPIAGSNGNSVLALKNKCGSSWRLVFGRTKQSKLEIGKIQARGFIRWLRSVNPGIKCIES